MDYKWVAIPAILLIVLGAIIFFIQPKTVPIDNVDFVDVEGDEYLGSDYITPAEEGIGDKAPIDLENVFPITLSDCDNYSIFQKDTCYALYARLQRDEGGCEIIKDQTYRDDCYALLAVSNVDENLCNKVKIGFQECMVDVAIEKKDATLCENGNFEKTQCFIAAKAQDYNLCADGYDRRFCNDAISGNNPSLCENVRDYSDFCYYTIGIDSSSPTLCNRAGVSRDSCLFRIALDTNNVAICETLTETRNSCVAWIAFNTNNSQLCYQAGSDAQSCLEDLSYT